jgi:hypothetical protein
VLDPFLEILLKILPPDWIGRIVHARCGDCLRA